MRATKISMQRIIEAAVTAVILAGIGYVMIIPRLEERINQQAMMTANQIIELKAAIASNEIQRQADYRYLAAQITRSDVKR